MTFIVILILAVLHCSIAGYLTENPDYYQLRADSWESEDFRAMKLGEAFVEMEALDGDFIASLMLEYDYDLRKMKKEDLRQWEGKGIFSKKMRLKAGTAKEVKPRAYKNLREAYEMVWKDLKYFPIPRSTDDKMPDITYQDSWGEGRSYESSQEKKKTASIYEKKSQNREKDEEEDKEEDKEEGSRDSGKEKYCEKKTYKKKTHEEKSHKEASREEVRKGAERKHEGCDLMGDKLPPGSYPVVSMTDGVVEQVGWLELGGWRVGIRAPGGAYFYYAHLYRYAGNLQKGDPVQAGQLIGYMGDTGYGQEEGTRGKFPCHLHVGIYLRDSQGEEMAINPYWLLRWLEKKRLIFSY